MSRRRIIIIDALSEYGGATGTELKLRRMTLALAQPGEDALWDNLSTVDWSTMHTVMAKTAGTWSSGEQSSVASILTAMAST